jgi:hypothetical protein
VTGETIMELDEMKTLWRELDRRMDRAIELDRRILAELSLGKARAALRRTTAPPVLELGIDILAVLLFGAFLAAHVHVVRYALPALVLHVAALLGLASTVYQLVLLGRIDYAAPVVEIQRQLAALRAFRVRSTTWTLLLAPLLWTPLVIVAAKGLLGLDLYAAFGPLWIALNLAFGVAVLALALWIARRHAGALRRSRFLQRLSDDIAGRSLAAAMGHLDEITRFAREA